MASEKFSENVASIAKVLQQRKVKCLVVGGTAVAFHGYIRPTTNHDGVPTEEDDFDFWFQPLYLNYMRMLDAFDDLGIDTTRFREEAHPFPKSSFFRFKPKEYTLDFLPRIGQGFNFWDCYQRRIVTVVEGTEISVIGIDDLIACKKATGRKKDLDDARVLAQMNNK